MDRLKNKVAVVTGAASGIGKGIATLFAAEGCKVLAADLNAARLDATVAEITTLGGNIAGYPVNIARVSEVETMIAKAVSTFGTLDILVNNAGIMDNFAPVGDVDDATWQRVFAVNVDGVYTAMRAAIRVFQAKGSGSIINIASIGGLQGARAGAAYTASKFAVVGLTKNTGYVYAKSGIRCNAIAPGGISTNIAESIDYSKMPALANERIMPGMVLNPRFGEPQEIAAAALFLASDESSFVNGAVLTVDGGWTAY
jgi:NAD(P)-dependent dehydrogenase (short-subunit alcohol dehydrogenase family)